MEEQCVRLQNRHGKIVQVPLNDGKLCVDTIKQAFPGMLALFYVDPTDNVATLMIQRDGEIRPRANGWSSDEGCFVVTDQEGITGDWRPMTGVCDWTTWSANIAPRITSLHPTSLAQLMDNTSYRVVCGIEIENWTRYRFSDPRIKTQSGHVSHPATTVMPATRGLMVGCKRAFTATGTSGTVSWLIDGDGRRLVVMWSAPFNFDFYSNRMAFGFTEENCREHSKYWFQAMDSNQAVSERIIFRRMVCKNTSGEISMANDIIEMSATMGTVHKPVIRIIVKPTRWENLAQELRVIT